MPIVQYGTVNTTALVVPDLYVQIVPPQQVLINGVPTNVVGLVGTASWGPVGSAAIVGSYADYTRQFGQLVARKFDMGTILATAVLQGANNFRCVRVTDGTDTAASGVLGTTDITFTAKYTGSVGNGVTVSLSNGSAAGSWRAVIACPGLQAEQFDNIAGTGNAFWVNLAAAINSGQSGLRGPSQIITATAGATTTTPTAESVTLAGGTDGASVSQVNLIGVDVNPRSGMYALRQQGCSIVALCDADDSTTWAAQVAFALAESVYVILTGAASQTITTAVTAKHTVGIDTYAAKVMLGDWLYWSDNVTGTVRLVSPQGFMAGRLANLSPEQSSLNKQIYGIVGSQRSGAPGSSQAQTYSSAELQAAFLGGIDIITNPVPGGTYWGPRGGFNASSNAAANDDSYTRMTNYIATTLQAGMGVYVGQVINPTTMLRVRSTLLAYLNAMLRQGLLATDDAGVLPFAVKCDGDNNPQSRTALGYLQADVQVRYQGIVKQFIVNIEGGQSVTIASNELGA